MKKRLVSILFMLLFSLQTSADAQISQIQAIPQSTPSEYGLGDATCDVFLFLAGSWLAHQQLPRLAGEQIEFNAPAFTKVFASILFTIGISGGILGAYSLAKILREKLNNLGKSKIL